MAPDGVKGERYETLAVFTHDRHISNLFYPSNRHLRTSELPMSALEAKVKDDIKRLLKHLGAWQFMPMQSMGKAGVPDHIACIPLKITQEHVGKTIGVFVGIEAKRVGKSPTERQWLQINQIKAAKGLAFFIEGRKSEAGNFGDMALFLERVFRG